MVNSIKTPKSPKVLMISPYFVPRKRVGALRSFKFAKHLKELDWQVCFIHLGERQSCYLINVINIMGEKLRMTILMYCFIPA